MRLDLKLRLFLALTGIALAALAVFFALQQVGLRDSFLGYVNRSAAERVASARFRLELRYARMGSWDFVEGRPRILMDALELGPAPGNDGRPPPRGPGMTGDDDRPPPRSGPDGQHPPRDGWDRWPPERGPPGGRDRPPERPPEPRDPPPPARDPPPALAANADGDRGQPNRGQPDRSATLYPDDRRPPPAGPFDIGPRLSLFDAQRRVVVAAAQPSSQYEEWPLHRGEEVVGYLRLAVAPRIEGFDELAFAREQLRFALWAAVAVLVLAALSAVLLAARLRAPIGRLARATQSLAGGDYTVRVDASRGDELGQLAADFNRLANALDDHRAVRRQWGADIAHELRTPLSILRGEIQALQDGVRPLDRAALDSLESECARLGRLIEDLYQLSLSDAGALEYRFEAVDLVELLRDQLDQRRATLVAAGLQLDLELEGLPTMPVRADAARLGQLIDNLLVNAERYTDAPGRILVRLARDGRHARLSVDDSAPGVPAAALPHLFERLYRVESSRNRASAGAGLGLAICRNIVLAHGGRIDASASPLGGLRVVVDLPMEAP